MWPSGRCVRRSYARLVQRSLCAASKLLVAVVGVSTVLQSLVPQAQAQAAGFASDVPAYPMRPQQRSIDRPPVMPSWLPRPHQVSLSALSRLCTGFVLGFSTGHVGTTTLSSRGTYNTKAAAQPLHFFFEPCVMARTDPQTLTAQRDFAGRIYVPKLLEILRSRHVKEPGLCVDLSHYWLSFYRGLLDVLNATGRPMQQGFLRKFPMENFLMEN